MYWFSELFCVYELECLTICSYVYKLLLVFFFFLIFDFNWAFD